MVSPVATAVFLVFLGLVVAALRARGLDDSPRQRARIQQLLAYTTVVSLLAGVAHVELWPFSRWNIFSERLEQPVRQVLVRGVDATGAEHAIDHRAFEPFGSVDLFTWVENSLGKLPVEQQREAGRYLLELVNRARARAVAGERVGSFERYFGRFKAPTHVLYLPIWNDRSRVPGAPFVGLRIYLERWNVFTRQRDPAQFERTLLFDWRDER